MNKLVRSIFFGNYFIGLIAIALSVESNVQLQLPLSSCIYYVTLFCAVVFYYTSAYLGPLSSSTNLNPRKQWYISNHKFILWSQRILFIICMVAGCIFIIENFTGIKDLNAEYWLLIFLITTAGILYYGLLPKSFYKINLRNTGWLKAFIIGFVWACSANLLSFIAVVIEKGDQDINLLFLIWLFIKNLMFCTVNAIIFDIKDYADDSNKHLKTFVVSFGLRRTIFFILMPLTVIGLASLVAVALIRNYNFITFGFNLLPFILLLMITWYMQKPHKILFYLVVIDGLIFFKALCGIAGAQFIQK